MIVKNNNDIITLLKMYMQNTGYKQQDIINTLNIKQSAVSRTFSNKHTLNIDTLLSYINAIDADLDINIIPKQNNKQNNEV